MSVIDNENKIKIKTVKSSQYTIPAVIRQETGAVSLEKALAWSLILHPLVIFLMLAASLILQLLGIDLSLFNKPPVKPKDIEFVLTDKEAPPIDKHTRNRADKNSRAGGKHDPKRAVSLPQQSAPKSKAEKPSSPAPAKKAEQPKKQQPAQNQQTKKPAVQQPAVQQQKPQPQVQTPAPQLQPPAPKPQAPKPAPAPSKAVPKPNFSSNFNIPAPSRTPIPSAQPVTAPVTPAPGASGSSSRGSSGGSGPVPSLSFSPAGSSRNGSGAGGAGRGAGGGGRFNGPGNSRGNAGNPGPGNPNGAPGIDAVKEPDFGPYMKELQRRIKMNWDPPKGNESKRVVLLFSIARDGRLLNVKVHKSSGLQPADNAAINAVKLTAPFRPLPPEFKGDKVDIQFTFDYTVFGISGY